MMARIVKEAYFTVSCFFFDIISYVYPRNYALILTETTVHYVNPKRSIKPLA